ncbi:hypothetical protein [Chryseobacterium sp. OSA05B]|uniref:hypothetical protein n=1 Tax=Chryseobacterium sp. OSA05B TaxID=2862650 RepID=UPI001CBFC388|nr:hypothetical protein [Chryseobacterium sp. OSA05B]
MKKYVSTLGIILAILSCSKNNCDCYGDKYQRTIKKSPSGSVYNDSGWKFVNKEKIDKRGCSTSDVKESSSVIDFLGDKTITETEYRQIKCSED